REVEHAHRHQPSIRVEGGDATGQHEGPPLGAELSAAPYQLARPGLDLQSAHPGLPGDTADVNDDVGDADDAHTEPGGLAAERTDDGWLILFDASRLGFHRPSVSGPTLSLKCQPCQGFSLGIVRVSLGRSGSRDGGSAARAAGTPSSGAVAARSV